MLLRQDTISYYLPSVQWASYWISRCAVGYCNRIHSIRLDLSQVFCLRDFRWELGVGAWLIEGSSIRCNHDPTSRIQISVSSHLKILGTVRSEEVEKVWYRQLVMGVLLRFVFVFSFRFLWLKLDYVINILFTVGITCWKTKQIILDPEAIFAILISFRSAWSCLRSTLSMTPSHRCVLSLKSAS